MITKNIETNEILFQNATVHRSQFGLPQIALKHPKMIIQLDEKTIKGINSMFEEFVREGGSTPNNFIGTSLNAQINNY